MVQVVRMVIMMMMVMVVVVLVIMQLWATILNAAQGTAAITKNCSV